MVVGLSTTAALLYLWLEKDSFFNRLQNASKSIAMLPVERFNESVSKGSFAMIEAAVPFLGTLVAIVIFVSITANIVVNKGLLFSMEPVKFDLSKINPAEGLKRIFSLRTVIELVKHVVKITVFLASSFMILRFSLQTPLRVPYCGIGCFAPTIAVMVAPILVLSICLLLFAGFLDVGVQSWLFRRQQRMTKTEAKRERKEQEGAPELRSAQKQKRQGILRQTTKYKPEDVTLFIEGYDVVVGARFVRPETPLPIIVCKGRGLQASEFLSLATANKIPVYVDEEFAAALYKRNEIGAHLREIFFDSFIRALKGTGQI